MNLHGRQVDEFTYAYIVCALWSTSDESRDDGGDPLDDNYEPEDLDVETLDAMIADCDRFRAEGLGSLAQVVGSRHRYHAGVYGVEDAGHDFWLSRNGHGAGFFDKSEARGDVWERLQDAAKRFGEANLYVYEGRIHHG